MTIVMFLAETTLGSELNEEANGLVSKYTRDTEVVKRPVLSLDGCD